MALTLGTTCLLLVCAAPSEDSRSGGTPSGSGGNASGAGGSGIAIGTGGFAIRGVQVRRRRLAIDMGGIHSATQGEVNLDQFASRAGLVVGQVYSLDLFNAERHAVGSNFKITTTMTFVDCGVDPVIR